MAQDLQDHYRTLGVSSAADSSAIHAAYRSLARRHHPDVEGDDQAMKALNAAWQVLRDPGRRAAYDRERRASPDHASQPPGGAFGPVLDFGRYDGWSLGEIARVDPGYLEWLRRTAVGAAMRADIDAVLEELAARPLTLRGRRPRFTARTPAGSGVV